MTFIGKRNFASYTVSIVTKYSMELQRAPCQGHRTARASLSTSETSFRLLDNFDTDSENSSRATSKAEDGNRCVKRGVRRQPSVQVSKRPVVSGAERSTHELPRDIGCGESANVLPRQIVRGAYMRPDRKQECCILYVDGGEGRRREWVEGVERDICTCLALPAGIVWSQSHGIPIQAVHVKGILNTMADSLSRNKETQ